MRTSARTAGCLLAALATLFIAAPARAAEVPSPWSWTNYGSALLDVSCATASSCVAVGQNGAVLRSPGLGDQPLAWTFVPLPPPATPDDLPLVLRAVSCTPSSCIAVSNTADPKDASVTSSVYRSTDGGANWASLGALPPSGSGADATTSAFDVACDPGPPAAAQRTCYIVGRGGGVWRSADDGVTWAALSLPIGLHIYDQVACASATCVAVGGEDKAYVSVLSGTTVTPLTNLPPTLKRGDAVACDTPTRCTVAAGNMYGSLALPGATWSAVRFFRPAQTTDNYTPAAMSCAAVDTCVALMPAKGLALRTAQLSTPGNIVWQRRPLGSIDLLSMTCIAQTCVAVGKHASWFVSRDGGDNWEPVNEVPNLDTVTCRAAFNPVCVAGGEKDLTVSRSGGQLWHGPLRGYAGLNVKGFQCMAPLTCLVLAKNMTLYSTDMEVFAARKPTILDPKGTDALACATDVLCVGLNDGVTYTTFDGAVTDWLQSGFPGRGGSIWCVPGQTDPVTCYALTRSFIVRGTMTVQGGLPHWKWVNTDADPEAILEAIACDPTGAQCTAVGANGYVMTTTTDPMHWTAYTIPAGLKPAQRPDFKTVTCPGRGVCLVGGGHGIEMWVASTANNWADYSIDKFPAIMGAQVLIKGFGCETLNRCVGVGSSALIGVRNPPLT